MTTSKTKIVNKIKILAKSKSRRVVSKFAIMLRHSLTTTMLKEF